jgi:hypothetical protein
VGADAAGDRSGRRCGGVEPARVGPADGQDPPRPAAAAELAAPEQGDRRRGAAGADEYLYRVVDALDEVAKETARPCRRWR